MRPFLLPLMLLGLLLPSAAAGTPRVFMLHDSTDDGYTYAGNLNQFGWLLLEEEGKTQVHKNAKIRITQNNETLYETLGGKGWDTGHDYDALNPFLYRFLRAGNYTVHAEVNLSGGAFLKAAFNGTVVERGDLVEASIQNVAGFPPSTQTLAQTPFKFQVTGPNGAMLTHADALFEVRDAVSNRLLFRTKLHSHEHPMEVDYAFAEPGAYKIKILAYQAYPEPTAVAFKPVQRTWTINAQAGPPPVVQPWSFAPSPGDGRYVLLHTYDPAPPGPNYDGNPVVSPATNVRLNLLVYDAKEKRLVPHVDFRATLLNAAGHQLFSSGTIHEYDGHLEVVTAPRLPGDYRLQVIVGASGWSAQKELGFRVAPPTNLVAGLGGSPPRPYPGCTGPVALSASGLASSFSVGRVELAANLATGDPCQHSEIDLQWVDAAGIPYLVNKLHTHGDGRFSFEAMASEDGRQQFILDAEAIHGDAATSFAPASIEFEAVRRLVAGPSPPLALGIAQGLPGPSLAFIVLALTGLIILRRRA